MRYGDERFYLRDSLLHRLDLFSQLVDLRFLLSLSFHLSLHHLGSRLLGGIYAGQSVARGARRRR